MADDLITQFRGIGIDAQAAVPAWTGLRPLRDTWFGMFSSWNFLFTRWRAVALAEGQIGVWSTWTGVPSRRVHVGTQSELQLVQRGRRYDRFALGRYRFWVTHDDGEAVMRWISRR